MPVVTIHMALRTNKISNTLLDQELMERNRRAWSCLLLRPRVLRQDIRSLETSVELVGGTRLRLPLALAPTAAHQAFFFVFFVN